MKGQREKCNMNVDTSSAYQVVYSQRQSRLLADEEQEALRRRGNIVSQVINHMS